MHTHIIRFVSGSPTQPHIIASCANSGDICVWNIHHHDHQQEKSKQQQQQQQQRPIIHIAKAHTAPIYKVFFSHDGNFLISSSQDRTIAIHEIKISDQDHQSPSPTSSSSFKLIRRIVGEFESGIRGLALPKFSHFIVAGGEDGQVKLFDYLIARNNVSNNNNSNPRHSKYCRTVAISFDEKFAISGGDDNNVMIFDIIVVSKDGNNSSRHHSLEHKHTFENHHKDFVRAVATVPNNNNNDNDNNLAVSASDDATLKIWNLNKCILLRTLYGHAPTSAHAPWIRTLAVAPNGKYCVSGAYDRSVRVWSLESINEEEEEEKQQNEDKNKEKETCSPEQLFCFDDHPNWVRSVAITNDSKFVISGSYDSTSRIYDVTNNSSNNENNNTKSRLVSVCDAHDDIIMHVSSTPDSQYALTASTDLTTKVWSLVENNNNNYDNATSRLFNSFGFTNMVLFVNFSKCSRYVLVASADHSVKVFENNGTNNNYLLCKGHEGWVRHVDSFCTSSSGCCYVVSGSSDRTVKIFKVPSSSSSTTPTIVTPLLSIPHPLQIIALCVVPSSTDNNDTKTTSFTILTGNGDQKMRKFKIKMRDDEDSSSSSELLQVYFELLQVYSGHTGWVRGIALSKDEKYIWTSSGDQTVRGWDYESGECKQILRDHKHIIPGICSMNLDEYFTTGDDNDDGENNTNTKQYFALSASYDKSIRCWSSKRSSFVKAFLGHKNWVRSVQFCPNLASVEKESDWKYCGVLGEIADNNNNFPMNRSDDSTTTINSSPGFVSGSYDRTLQIRNIAVTKDLEESFCNNNSSDDDDNSNHHSTAIDDIPHDTEHLLDGYDKVNIKEDRNEEDLIMKVFSKSHPGAVLSVAISPNGRSIVTGCDDGKVRMFCV